VSKDVRVRFPPTVPFFHPTHPTFLDNPEKEKRMSRKLKVIIFIFILSFMAIGCENSIVRNFGGKMIIDLPPGEKLIEVTWKNDDLWYLTRPMRQGEVVESYTFQEKSTYGNFEGSVILKETYR
jgi:hypothetical protein